MSNDSETGSFVTQGVTEVQESTEKARLVNVDATSIRTAGESVMDFTQDGVTELVVENRLPEDTRAIYNIWANSYDEDMLKRQYKAPNILADYIAADLKLEKNARILDAGCGTGLLAVEMSRLGFKAIDGVDVSEEMLNEAQKKKLYKNCYLENITPDSKLLKCHANYNCIALSNSLAPGHITFDCLKTLATHVSPGGYIVSLGRDFAELASKCSDFNSSNVSRFVKDISKLLTKTEQREIIEIKKNVPGTLICFQRISK